MKQYLLRLKPDFVHYIYKVAPPLAPCFSRVRGLRRRWEISVATMDSPILEDDYNTDSPQNGTFMSVSPLKDQIRFFLSTIFLLSFGNLLFIFDKVNELRLI